MDSVLLFSQKSIKMVPRQLSLDKWLYARSQFIGERLCVAKIKSGNQIWSHYLEYAGATLMCVTYLDKDIADIFPLSSLYL